MDDDEPLLPKQAGGAAGLMLALFLLLLAFFILLNSISEVRTEKAEAALGSIISTFQKTGPRDQDQPQVTRSTSVRVPSHDYQIAFMRIFDEELALERIDLLYRGEVMRVVVPLADLFDPGRAVFLTERAALLDRLAGAMADQDPRVRAEMEIIVVTRPDGDRALGGARAAALARELSARGAPEATLTAGLFPAGVERVEFYVRQFDPERAAVTFEQVLYE